MIYCSLDLEGTGLDPKKDAITEVGAVLFEIKAGEVIFHEEFSQLVKPNIPIPKFIQELTNIREADVADAPAWEDVLPDFKKFVGKHIIVGQNIQFDLKFLEAYGLPFEQDSIDTKDLASTFLPKAEYYNLEYLMRYFGLPLETHHRALEDSKSAAKLLGQIILKFQSLPTLSQKRIFSLISGSGLPYKGLFVPVKSPKTLKLAKLAENKALQQSLFTDNTKTKADLLNIEDIFEKQGEILLDLPWEINDEILTQDIFEKLKNVKKSLVISVGERELFEQMKSKLSKDYVILDEDIGYFSDKKFEELSVQKNLPDSLAQFLIKIMVWNLEKEITDDFSTLPLAGEEYFFRTLISGNFEQDRTDEKHEDEFGKALFSAKIKHAKIFTTHNAWLDFSRHTDNKFDLGIFHNFTDFESALDKNLTHTVSLKNLRTAISLLHDPESGKGLLQNPTQQVKKIISELLVNLDFCFGLIGMSVSSELGFGRQRVVDEFLRSTENFSKTSSAFTKLILNLDRLQETFSKESADKIFATKLIFSLLKKDEKFLKEFSSEPQPDTLYWIEIFNNQVKLKGRTYYPNHENFGKFGTRITTVDFSSVQALHYASSRLAYKSLFELKINIDKTKVDVYLPDEFPLPKHPNSQKITNSFLAKILPKFSGRTIVLFNSQKFLEESYDSLQKKEYKDRLFAQRVSGHQWKNKEAYESKKNAIWFLTAHNFFRNVHHLPQTNQVIILRLPYEIPGIWEAVYDRSAVFSEFILPKTEIKLAHGFARFISSGETSSNKKIIFLDQRITEDYNEVLLESLKKKTDSKFFSFGIQDHELFFE